MTDDNVWTDQELEDGESDDGREPGDADPAADLDADLRKLQDERDRLFEQLARGYRGL
jgi:hypothetical protein